MKKDELEKQILSEEENVYNESLEESNRQLKILQDAKMDIRKTIRNYLLNLKTNNSIDNINELNKLLEEDELEEFHWDYTKYVQKAKQYDSFTNKKSQEAIMLDRALKNSSLKYRLTRKEALLSKITMKLVELGFEREKALKEHLEKIARNGSIVYSPRILNHIDNIVNMPWAGNKTFSQRIWKDVDRLKNIIKDQIPKTIVTGNLKGLIKGLETEFNTSKFNAKRLVLTESARVHNKTRLDKYKDLGVKEVEILATLDLKTSEICREKDRTKVRLEKAEIGIDLPPFHPHCRTVFIASLSQETEDIVKNNKNIDISRIERDIKTDKSVIRKDKDFKEYEKKIGKEKLDILSKKHRNYNRDKEQYEKYKKVLGYEKMPETFDLFQEMKYIDIEEYTNFKNRYSVLTKEEFHKLKSGAQQKHLPGTNNYSNVVRKAFDKSTNRIDDFSLKSYFGEEAIDFKKYIDVIGLDGKINTSEYIEKLKESSIEYSKKIEEVILRKMGSGDVDYKNGRYTETLNLENENIKGWVYDETNKKWIKTNYVKVHYSKDGFHIVPHYNIEKE